MPVHPRLEQPGSQVYSLDLDLQVALNTCQHPFSRIIIDHSRNFFEDVLANTADLLYVTIYIG
jgi:hypothetical protein